eukprot:PRCOL_00002788-RA
MVRQADEPELPEEREGAAGREGRYDEVDNFQYELPEDFEDEEITSESDAHEDGDGSDGEGDGDLGDFFGVAEEGDEGDDDDDEEDGESSGEEEEEEEEEEDCMTFDGDAEDDGADEGRHASMIADVLGRGADARGRSRRRDADTVTAGAREGEAHLASSGAARGVSVDDIAAAVGGGSADARRMLRRVAERARSGAAVSAPLPANIAARLERKAGYEASKAELAQWQDMVQRNRKAELEDLRKKSTTEGSSTAALGAKFSAKESGVEADVDGLLAAAGLTEERAAAAAEELELNELAVDEVADRQAKLARMRSLMFRHEVKAKRAKKIKSRAYHKHLKKAALKEGNMALDDGAADGLVGDEESRRELAKRREFERLEERLTLKHKNTGKWAKQMLKAKLGGHNTSVRQAVAEQLRLNKALTRKMDSMRDEEDSDSSADEGESSDEDEGGKGRKASVKALEELVNEEEGAELPSKGLFSLPFMKRAIEKRRADAQKEAGKVGKKRSAPGARARAAAAEEEDEEVVYDMEGGEVVRADADGATGAKRARGARDADSAAAAARIAAMAKAGDGNLGGGRVASVMGAKPSTKAAAPPLETGPVNAAAIATANAEALEADDHVGAEASAGAQEAAAQQRSLLREAFADDDVAADFAREKAALLDEELPPGAETAAEEAAGMPGWGSWTGAKKSARQKKKEAEAAKKAAKARREAEAKRRDAGKSHVIISEKYDKKAATLTARQVPFGFGSREVYEASLRQPLGREFNSDRTYRDLNRPKLLTTAGAVIAAPKKPTATGGGAGGSGRAKGSAGKRKPLGVK